MEVALRIALLESDEKVIEVLPPTDALEVLPPKTECGQLVHIRLRSVSKGDLDRCMVGRFTYCVERVENELFLDHGGLHIGIALPHTQ